MTDRRKKLMAKLITANPTESEQKMTQLVMERICLDMCDFYDKFYKNEGPGAIVYAPLAKKEDDTMFYLTVAQLIGALEDLRNKEFNEIADIMQKAIRYSESLDPETEALFIIQDNEQMSLHLIKKDTPVGQELIT